MPDGEPTASNTDRKRVPLIWLIPCLLICVLAIGYLLASRSEEPQTQFEWMSLQQILKSTQPGPLQRLTYNMASFVGLLKWYKPNQPKILIDVDVFRLPAQWEASSEIFSPFSTNQEGDKAWILHESDLRKVKDMIMDASGAAYIASARVTNSQGWSSELHAPMVSIDSGVVGTIPVDVTVDLLPQIVAHSIRLVVGVNSTASPNATNGTNTIRMDAAIYSRVLLPNGGGLLLSAEGKVPSANSKFWIIISPAATNAKGGRIKL